MMVVSALELSAICEPTSIYPLRGHGCVNSLIVSRGCWDPFLSVRTDKNTLTTERAQTGMRIKSDIYCSIVFTVLLDNVCSVVHCCQIGIV